MSSENWTIIGVGGILLWGLGSALDKIYNVLVDIKGILHRIRIQDHERDW